MAKNSFLTFLGILIAITPFLGIPRSSKTFIFVVSGLIVAIFSYTAQRKTQKPADTFVENRNQIVQEA